jgi:hypothetical protein
MRGGALPFAGKQLSYKQSLALCYAVGFRGRVITRAVAVACAESGRYEGAYHVNDDGSVDRGYFQINDLHVELTDEEAYQAKPNAAYAFKLSQGGEDFTPWAAYNSGRYLLFVPLVFAVRVLGTWRSRIRLYA